MEAKVRNKKLSVNDELLKNPKQFSFEMAAYILGHGAKVSFGKETNLALVPFRTQSINSFHLRGTEIEKISEVNGVKLIYTERLSISGLNAPLPTPYAELIFRRSLEKDDAMSAFLNAFNMRLLGVSYQISKRRYLNLQNHEKNCMFMRTVAAISGEPPAKMNRNMARLAYLFWTKEKSASGLESVVSSFLKFTTSVKEFRTFWAERRDVLRLGSMALGKNSEIGTRVSMSSFGVEIDLRHDDYNKIFQLLTDSKYLDELKALIKKYLGEFFNCVINVAPKNVPPLKMGSAILGKTSWIPAKILDSTKIMC